MLSHGRQGDTERPLISRPYLKFPPPYLVHVGGGGACSLSRIQLFCNLIDSLAHHAPLSMGFPWQEYWSELLFLSAGDLPGPRMEPASPALAGRFFTTEPPGKPI